MDNPILENMCAVELKGEKHVFDTMNRLNTDVVVMETCHLSSLVMSDNEVVVFACSIEAEVRWM